MSPRTTSYVVVCGRLVRAPKRRQARVEGSCDLSEAGVLAAWTAADETMRNLTAELERRDAVDDFARQGTYTSARSDRHNIDAEYTSYLEAEYNAAAHATKAYMVSAAGLRHGFKGSDFFKVGRRPSVEKWGSDVLRAWFGSGHVLSKTEYARLITERKPEGVAA